MQRARPIWPQADDWSQKAMGARKANELEKEKKTSAAALRCSSCLMQFCVERRPPFGRPSFCFEGGEGDAMLWDRIARCAG